VYVYSLRRNSHPASRFLNARWPRSDGANIRLINYDDAKPLETRPGLHIFTDIELLTGEPHARAVATRSSTNSPAKD
jgi:hypothetical protein